MKSSAIILCGGLGTRLRSAVPDRPKCMALINGRPFLDYQIRWLKTQGVKEVVLAVGFKSQQVIEFFGDGTAQGVKIKYSLEHQPLGTGGATRNAMLTHGLENCLVMNGDSFIDIDLQRLEEFFYLHQAEVCVACHLVERSNRFGVVKFDSQNRLMAFAEKKLTETAAWINSGIYMLNHSIFEGRSAHDKFSLEDDLLTKPSTIARYVFQCGDKPFIDIGTPESYQTADDFFAKMKI